jgi:hypothetical protein
LIRRAARRIAELLDGVESGNHAAGRRRRTRCWNPKLKLIREILLTRETRGCRISDGNPARQLAASDEYSLVAEGTIVLDYRF